ncbi:hypothetical protein [Rhizobium sp. RU35A]|uniref:hypothetical protein n=1 Tax=Rhizobium sp. RU35A TaxID=1907414 RepID=UPI0016600617|nr:hypothetical protein [Rhizobium sp. RU35A]
MQLQQTRVSVPAEARIPCAPPLALPDRRLSEAEATSAWGRDRGELRICDQKRAAAVAAIDSTGGAP